VSADELANTAILRALIDEGVIVSSHINGWPHSWPGCDGMLECSCPPPKWEIARYYRDLLRDQGVVAVAP
jgi:hypothetical protein